MGAILRLSLPRLLVGFSSNGSKGRRRFRRPRAILQANDDDPLLRAAVRAAALRCQETNRPDPLIIDPYAGCFIPSSSDVNMNPSSALTASPCHYCLASKFIDDKLLSHAEQLDGGKQIVLLTDGMDTRPYRLNWPQATMIFDMSPERIFKIGSERLKGAGAKISRSSVFIHVPWESCDIPATLRSKGFNGNRPSIWALQGLPVTTSENFKEILLTVGSLAMKGSIFLGELPAWLAETEVASKSNIQEWMHELFMSNGFRVFAVSYEEIAREVLRDLPLGDYGNIVFVAEQLQLSDDQMECWRKEFQRLEEEADEEGFEEL